MNEQVQHLEKAARRCMQLALGCRNAQARKIMRLLAADLIVAAEEQRRATVLSLDDELANLIRGNRPSVGAD
jgi:hypothetical protein